jgi:hypothetical protein
VVTVLVRASYPRAIGTRPNEQREVQMAIPVEIGLNHGTDMPTALH